MNGVHNVMPPTSWVCHHQSMVDLVTARKTKWLLSIGLVSVMYSLSEPSLSSVLDQESQLTALEIKQQHQ